MIARTSILHLVPGDDAQALLVVVLTQYEPMHVLVRVSTFEPQVPHLQIFASNVKSSAPGDMQSTAHLPYT